MDKTNSTFRNRTFCSMNLFFILFLLIGCTPQTLGHDFPENEYLAFLNQTRGELTLKEIIGKEASPDQKRSPEEAAVSQIEWKMSDQTVISASRQNIVFHSVFGKQSVVVLHVPGTAKRWYNVVFLANREGQWNMTGVVDLPIPAKLDTDKQGLALPMDKFLAVKHMVSGATPEQVWTFASDNRMVAIGKYPRQALTPPEDAESIHLNGHAAWVRSDKSSALLFYFDKDELVWICGTLSAKEIQDLAKSLPPADSARFPMNAAASLRGD